MPTPPTLASRSDISQVDYERKAQEICYAWLASFFDGATHTITEDPELTNLSFPACDFRFNAAELPQQVAGQPLKPVIHTVFQDPRRQQKSMPGNIRRIWLDMLWAHWVRVGRGGDSFNAAEDLCLTVANRLTLLYDHQTDLDGKGVHHATIERPPQPLATSGYAVRLMTVRVSLRWDEQLAVV